MSPPQQEKTCIPWGACDPRPGRPCAQPAPPASPCCGPGSICSAPQPRFQRDGAGGGTLAADSPLHKRTPWEPLAWSAATGTGPPRASFPGGAAAGRTSASAEDGGQVTGPGPPFRGDTPDLPRRQRRKETDDYSELPVCYFL